MMYLFVKIDGKLKIQFFVLWITRFISQHFSRVHVLGRFDFDIITKYILLLLSTAKTKMQISTNIQNGGGAVEGGESQQEEFCVCFVLLGAFIFSISTIEKNSQSPMLTLQKRLEG